MHRHKPPEHYLSDPRPRLIAPTSFGSRWLCLPPVCTGCSASLSLSHSLTLSLSLSAYACVCVCVYVRLYLCVCLCMRLSVSVRVSVCMCLCFLCAGLSVSLCLSVSVFASVYVHRWLDRHLSLLPACSSSYMDLQSPAQTSSNSKPATLNRLPYVIPN